MSLAVVTGVSPLGPLLFTSSSRAVESRLDRLRAVGEPLTASGPVSERTLLENFGDRLSPGMNLELFVNAFDVRVDG